MQQHQGAHPRLGAVDVVPFVPVKGVSKEEAVELAHRLGEWIGEQGVPVYYYQDAATRPERELLPDVRRGEYEGLAARIVTAEWAPDAGPAVFNARSGASIVGVRFPLVAFNVNLATTDLGIAKRIAEGVRHSGGGYRYVRAMGVNLEDKGQVQVSLDITQYEKTPLHRVFETIKSEAAGYGVAVADCELIGLVAAGGLRGHHPSLPAVARLLGEAGHREPSARRRVDLQNQRPTGRCRRAASGRRTADHRAPRGATAAGAVRGGHPPRARPWPHPLAPADRSRSAERPALRASGAPRGVGARVPRPSSATEAASTATASARRRPTATSRRSPSTSTGASSRRGRCSSTSTTTSTSPSRSIRTSW